MAWIGWRGVLGHLPKFELMTVDEAFYRGDYPGKDYDVEPIPNMDELARLEAIGLADQTKISGLRCGGNFVCGGSARTTCFMSSGGIRSTRSGRAH